MYKIHLKILEDPNYFLSHRINLMFFLILDPALVRMNSPRGVSSCCYGKWFGLRRFSTQFRIPNFKIGLNKIYYSLVFFLPVPGNSEWFTKFNINRFFMIERANLLYQLPVTPEISLYCNRDNRYTSLFGQLYTKCIELFRFEFKASCTLRKNNY